MASNLGMGGGGVSPQTQIGQQMAQGPDLISIMQMLQSTEGLPEEVMQLAEHRRKMAEKENKKANQTNLEEMDNLLKAAMTLGLGQPQQPAQGQVQAQQPEPMGDQGSLAGLLNGVLGQVGPDLGI